MDESYIKVEVLKTDLREFVQQLELIERPVIQVCDTKADGDSLVRLASEEKSRRANILRRTIEKLLAN